MPPSIDGLALASEARLGMVVAAVERESALGLARRAEALGFDSLWVGDHLSFHVPILESLSLLAFLAGATERVTLGSGVFLLPLRRPVVAAKMVASIDVLAGGRLILGVGVGGEFPPEFDAAEVPRDERGPRTDEAIELLRRLWSEDAVVHEGRFHRFGPVTLAPKPRRPGGPPIWIGGRKAPSMRRAGALGDGYLSHMASPDQIGANLRAIAGEARASARGVGSADAARPADASLPFGTGSLLFTVLDESYERALDRAAQMLGTIYDRPFRDAARKYCLLGRAEDCLDQMQRFADAGTRHFVLSPLSEPLGFAEQVAAEILPEIPRLRIG